MYNYYNQFFERGQQVINFNLYQIGLPEDDPVYTIKKVMEEMDFSKLLTQYSYRGRKGYNPIMLFAVTLYASLRGVRAVDRIVELCQRDIAFIWLAQGERPKRDAFYDFKNDKLTTDILEDLHYQFIRKLEKEKLVSLTALFIDGTKIEANANRYTFVWRGSINYRLVGLLDSIETLYDKYNNLLLESGYHRKHKLPLVDMFVIEGIDKVKEVIEKNRNRKINNKKKISNNTMIEIDNISPLEMLQLQMNLQMIAVNENIFFTTGKGQKKHEVQKLYEDFEALGARLLKYKEAFKIMGANRNSYSKTDLEATFMRMKDDHMQNGQLKPAYNVQIAVENYFVIHAYVSSDRTDYNPMIPVMDKHKKRFNCYPSEATMDSGYCSEKNLLFLDNHGIDSYTKLQEHEKMKTRAYQNNIGKHYNMQKSENGYICSNNRELTLERTEISKSKGFERSFSVYSCEDCSGCGLKSQCLYKYDEEKDLDKNKTMKINERWEKLKEASNANIQSEKGIYYRQIRSIQTEGFFGDMKENDGFRRFNHRSCEKVYKELMLYIFGKNIDKFFKFKTGKIKKYEIKTEQVA